MARVRRRLVMHGIIVAAIAAVALALGPDPSAAELRVFVTNEKSDDVTVIAAATGDVLKTIAVGKRPRGVAGSPTASGCTSPIPTATHSASSTPPRWP
jgi:YVTN family beta-propeller protein